MYQSSISYENSIPLRSMNSSSLDIMANKAMQLYFHRTEKRFRGRPTTTLPVIINKDLSQTQDNLSLKSTDDLKYLRSLAQDRDQWKSLTKQIVEIAEASRSDDQDAKSE